MDITILEDLGLTEGEIKVYLALLQLGSTTAGPILSKAKLQNSVVHRALNSLIEKGLINYIQEGKRKIYQATDPENFYHFMDEKKRRFTEILPELKQKQLSLQNQTNATIYKGKRGINEVYHILIALKAKEYNTFGGGYNCEQLMGTHWWKNFHTQRIENKLPARQIFDETVRGFGNELRKKPISQVRFIDQEFAQFQETIIIDDYVAISVFTENPYAFLIKDKIVAEGYKKYFELLWKIAKV